MDKAAVKHIIDGLEGSSDKTVDINCKNNNHHDIKPKEIEYLGESTISFPTRRSIKTFVDIGAIEAIVVSVKTEKGEMMGDKCERSEESIGSQKTAVPQKAIPKAMPKSADKAVDF